MNEPVKLAEIVKPKKTKASVKQFVLLNRRTGDLQIGYRVMMMDYVTAEDIFTSETPPGWPYKFGIIEQHGWVIENPEFQVPWFMNMKSEKFFENLGEL